MQRVKTLSQVTEENLALLYHARLTVLHKLTSTQFAFSGLNLITFIPGILFGVVMSQYINSVPFPCYCHAQPNTIYCIQKKQ